MTVSSQTCYFAVCDGCQETLQQREGFTMHFDNEGDAISEALDSGWQDKPDLLCAECLEMAGDGEDDE